MVIFQIIQKDTSCPLQEENFSLAPWCSRAGSVQMGGRAERLGAAAPGECTLGDARGEVSCLQLPALAGPHCRLSGAGYVLTPWLLLS